MRSITRAAAFIRRSGADGLGHVGWSFQYPDGAYCGGSVENPAGLVVSPPGGTGFWSQRIIDPIAPMRLLSYDAFKMFEVPNADVGRADSTVAWIAQQPYVAIFRNCLDATYDVLRSYGVPELPLPTLEITPNHWFDSLHAESHPVSLRGLLETGLLPRLRVGIDEQAPKPHPKAPPWRTPGTQEWQAFHEHLLHPTMKTRMAQQGQDRQSMGPAVKSPRHSLPSLWAVLAGVAFAAGIAAICDNARHSRSKKDNG